MNIYIWKYEHVVDVLEGTVEVAQVAHLEEQEDELAEDQNAIVQKSKWNHWRKKNDKGYSTYQVIVVLDESE